MNAPSPLRSGAVMTLWLLVAAGGACQRGTRKPGGTDDGVGQIALALSGLPAEVRCLRIAATGPSTIDRLVDVRGDAPTLVLIEGLPVGTFSFQVQAFERNCSDIVPNATGTAIVAAWQAGPQPVTVSSGAVSEVALTLRRTGGARLTIGFDHSDAGAHDGASHGDESPACGCASACQCQGVCRCGQRDGGADAGSDAGHEHDSRPPAAEVDAVPPGPEPAAGSVASGGACPSTRACAGDQALCVLDGFPLGHCTSACDPRRSLAGSGVNPACPGGGTCFAQNFAQGNCYATCPAAEAGTAAGCRSGYRCVLVTALTASPAAAGAVCLPVD